MEALLDVSFIRQTCFDKVMLEYLLLLKLRMWLYHLFYQFSSVANIFCCCFLLFDDVLVYYFVNQTITIQGASRKLSLWPSRLLIIFKSARTRITHKNFFSLKCLISVGDIYNCFFINWKNIFPIFVWTVLLS